MPAIVSIVDSVTRASADGRPYSLSQTRDRRRRAGAAIAIAIAATMSVPISGSRKPPVSACVEARRRVGDEQLGAHVA